MVSALGAWHIIAIPAPLRAALILLTVGVFVAAIRRHALLRGGAAVLGTSFLPQGEIALTTRNGTHYGRLTNYYLSPLLTIFVVRCNGKNLGILAAVDSMEKDAHRKLRINLRIASDHSNSDPPA